LPQRPLFWAGLLARASAFANATARLRQDDGTARAGAVDLWVFDRLDRIGDHPTTILGNPRVIDSPIGGVRMNLVNYFKGAIHLARFTRRALSPSEFLKVPAHSR
jgi:hypothetical protein